MNPIDFLSLFGATWNTTFEATPAGTDNPGEGDNKIRELKAEVGDRGDQEHVWMDTASTAETIHREGTARAYYQAAAPTLRPDGITALGASDDGRIWVDSDTNDGYVWTGSAFVGLGMNTIVDQEGGTHLKIKIVNIGDWDMDATASVNVAHGLTLSTIRSVEVGILKDDSTVLTTFDGTANGDRGYVYCDATNAVLTRVTSGLFDSTNYNATSFNRGYITIYYAEA